MNTVLNSYIIPIVSAKEIMIKTSGDETKSTTIVSSLTIYIGSVSSAFRWEELVFVFKVLWYGKKMWDLM